MKIKGCMIIGLLLLNLVPISSVECKSLNITMINQDPFPAIQGDYVKILFQVKGLMENDCGDMQFELLEKYPISFDPNEPSVITAKSGIYSKDFSSLLHMQYKVRIDEQALDGENPIELQIKSGTGLIETKTFNLEVKDIRADFEIFIKNYNSLTKEIDFEILNTAKSDIKSLTLEIPKQKNINIIGSKTSIVGDLDSNDFTSADFQGTLTEGEIKITMTYTDEINKRRTIEKTVTFEPEYFPEPTKEKSIFSILNIVLTIIIITIIYLIFKKTRKKKKK